MISQAMAKIIRRQAWESALLNGHLMEAHMRCTPLHIETKPQRAIAAYTINAVDGSVQVILEIGLQ